MLEGNERHDDALVDLGSVESETRGNSVGIEDTAGGQQLSMGLSDAD